MTEGVKQTTLEEVQYILDDVAALLTTKEDEYGDAWKLSGRETCVNEVFRKANYLRVQWEHGRYSTAKFREDLLDLMAWAALACRLVDEGVSHASSS